MKHPRDPLRVWSYKKAQKILEFYHFLQRSILPRFPGTVIKVQEHFITVQDEIEEVVAIAQMFQ